jgi:hypothetical protein
VYVTTNEPAMHCVDATTGEALWVAPNITQFAAASHQRLYGIDDLRALVVLDAKTGAMLDRMPTDGTGRALVNDQTDRLYLVSDGGLLQCLHEIGAEKPLYHNPQPVEAPKPKPGAETAAETATETAPPPAEDTDSPPPADTEDPFGDLNDGGAEPADNGGFGVGDDNPFGE